MFGARTSSVVGSIYDHLKDYLIEAGERAFLTLAANSVQKNLSSLSQHRFQSCLDKASTKGQYGDCILSSLSTRRRAVRDWRSHGRQRRYAGPLDPTDDQVKNGSVGVVIANYVTNLIREVKKSLPADSDLLLPRKIFSRLPPDQIAAGLKRTLEVNNNIEAGVSLLSPRVLSVLPKLQRARQSILSPDVLSLHDGPDTIASVPSLLSYLSSSDDERGAWLQLVNEVTGVDDILRQIASAMDNALEVKSVDTIRVTDSDVTLEDNRLLHTLLEDLAPGQRKKIEQRGFALMKDSQLRLLSREPFEDPISEDDGEDYLMLTIRNITDRDRDIGRGRNKRQQFAKPTFLQPGIGGTIFVIYLLAPATLSPGLFFYLILGPVVLSPFILSPFVLSPFILAPTVLSPFILDPYVLSPFILDPLVLSPIILTPSVLSPTILSPFVLSPSILDPSVGSPLILSPYVLSPFILTPSTLTATILSPGRYARA